MVTPELSDFFTGFLKLAILTSLVLYAGIVLINYGADVSRKRPQYDSKDPARWAERMLVWFGVVILSWIVRKAARTFAMLSDASAVVGEWYLRRAREALASPRSSSRQ